MNKISTNNVGGPGRKMSRGFSRWFTYFVAVVLATTQADAQVSWYRDLDGDGWGNASVSQVAATKPSGYVLNNFDCNDNYVNGTSWLNDGAAGFSAGSTGVNDIAVSKNGTRFVAYRDNSNGSRVTVMKNSGSGWTLVGNAGFTPDPADEVSLAVDNNNIPYVAYHNSNNSTYGISVMKYNNSQWVHLDSPLVGVMGSSPDLVVDKNNILYVAYTNSASPTVKKYNGSQWVAVGSPIFNGYYTKLAIDNSGSLYMLYYENNSEIYYVAKYDGSNWVNMGGAIGSFYLGAAYANLAVDTAGIPYVIYGANGYGSNLTTVVKYNSGNWSELGGGVLSANTGTGNIAIDATGTPYVVYQDFNSSGKAVVRKYNGSSWVALGNSLVTSPGSADNACIAIDSIGLPHVAFNDFTNAGKLSVMSPRLTILGAPTVPMVEGPQKTYCGNAVTLSVETGSLNDAAKWKWYTGSCGGTPIDSGTTITVTQATDSITYYVRGEGGCSFTPGNCGSKTVSIRKFKWYADNDNDGWGLPGSDSISCAKPTGYVLNNLDCNGNRTNDTSWLYDGTAGFSTSFPSIVKMAIAPNGTRYVAYSDVSLNHKITVMKNDGSGWALVGSAGFTAKGAGNLSIVVDDNNVPYVACAANDLSSLLVMKYNGSNWVNAGADVGYSPSGMELKIGPGNTPYMVSSHLGKPVLNRFDGNNWVPVGNFVNFGQRTSFAFDAGGTPYIVYDNGNDVFVYKYKGSSWMPVGGSLHSLGNNSTFFLSIAVDGYGTPYVFYAPDYLTGTAQQSFVKKYNGSNWVATANIPNGVTQSGNIVIAPFGTPYIAFTPANLGRSVVYRYDGSSWLTIGNSAAVSPGGAGDASIVLDGNGIPYISFRDGNNSNKASVIKAQPGIVQPNTPVLATSDTLLCGGTTATLSIQSGNLNHASQWHWYSSSCGGTPVGTGASIQVTPASTTTYYARAEGSCLSSPGVCDSIVIKAFANPVVTSDPRDSTVCNNSNASFRITATGDNSLTYQWQVNTGSGYTNVSNTGVHSGATSATLLLTGPSTAMSGYLYRCIVTNGCSIKDTSGAAMFTIYPVPTVNIVTDKVACNSAATSVNFSGAVSGTTYSWTNNTTSIGLAAAGTGNISSFNAVNTGITPVVATVIVTPSANGCVGVADTFTITVNPTPTVNATSNQTLCNGAATTAVSFSGAVSGSTYSWTNNTTSIGLGASGLGSISSFTAVNTGIVPVTATITVTPSANSCSGTPRTFTITVNPTPTVNAVTNQALCNGATTAAINYTGAVSGTSYSWTNTTTSIGLAASGSGNINSFTAVNTGIVPGTATITVTPYANGCTGAAGTFTITVNPTPTVNAVSNQTLCNDATTAVVGYTGAVSGTSYSWTNNTTSIGLGASGLGSISSFTASNTGIAPVTATITVTPSANSCTGASRTFTITVNPTPTVNAVSNQTLCNGATSAAINYTGAVNGSTYSWTNNTTSIGLGASGTGNISSFNATNTGTAPVTATITVTPSANGCTGAAGTFTITVNPTPTVNAVSNQTLCNDATTAVVGYTGAVSGSTYSWTNNTTSIGLGASGLGNISSFTAVNTGIVPVTATITITPSANSCTGASRTFTITVNPTPTVNNISNQTLCNTASTAAVTFSGSVTGTTYNWTNNTTSIGLGASGTGNIGSFTPANTGTSPVNASITVTPTANSCLGSSTSFTFTVNPTPTVNTVSNQSICNGSSTTAISFSSPTSGTTYTWVNDNTSIGLGGTGSGNIPPFTVTNITTAPVMATIAVTPVANTCTGVLQVFYITANPIPALSSVSSAPPICSAQPFNYIPTSATSGTSFTWSRSAIAGISNAAATGNGNPAEILINTTPNPIKVTYNYSFTANNCNNAADVDVVINPIPRLSSVLSDTICSGAEFFYMPASLTQGTQYKWARTVVSGITPNLGTGTGDIGEVLTNSTTAAINVKYAYTLSAAGCINIENLNLLVNPVPAISNITVKSPGEMCGNTQFQNFGADKNPPAGAEYWWTTNNAVVWSMSTTKQNALISFPNPGRDTVRLITTITATSCTSEARHIVNISNDIAANPEIVYYNNRFICMHNDMDIYRWGYDDKESLDSTIVLGETNQDYLNLNPDFNKRSYWVITTKGSCMQKSYYNTPASVTTKTTKETYVKVYPNPANSFVTIEFETAISKNSELRVFDMTGKLLKSMPAEQKNLIDIGALAEGVYMVSCLEDGVKIAIARFVKH